MGADRSQWQFPKNEADKVLGWRSNGQGLENKSATDIVSLLTVENPDLSVDTGKLALRGDVKTNLDAKPETVATRTAMEGLADVSSANLIEAGYEGLFKFVSSDLSSTVVLSSKTSTAVNSGTGAITIVGHGWKTAYGVISTTSDNGLTGLTTVYWVIKDDDDTIRLASSKANAVAGTSVTLTGTTNITLKRLLDPNKNIYRARTGDPLDGSAGMLVRIGADASGSRYQRMQDRVLVGDAAFWTGELYSQGGTGSWLMDEGGGEIGSGLTPMSYLLVNATIAGIGPASGGGYGVVGAAKVTSGLTTGSAIGVAGYASGYPTSGSSQIWGGYFDAVQQAGSNTLVNGVEIEATRLNSSLPTGNSPYASFVQGRVYGLAIGAGAGTATHPTSYEVDTALQIFYNGATFRNGINLRSNALSADAGTGYQHALLLGSKMRLEWFIDATTNIGWTIHSEVTTLAKAQRWIINDTGWAIYDTGAVKWFEVAYAGGTTANGIRVTPGTTGVSPIIAPIGETNTGLDIDVKGTGGGRIRGGDGLAKMRWSSTGVGFLGAAPVGQQTMAAATGTAKRTTFATSTVTLAELAGVVMALIDDSRARGFHA